MSNQVDKWLEDIKSNGKAGWIRLYKAALSQPISHPKRFFIAVEQYGDFAMFEAIITTSTRLLEGDALGYVLKVAHEKWKQQLEQVDQQERYIRALEKSKLNTQTANLDLARKIEEARRLNE